MAQTIQTKKAKDLAQETSAAKMQTAKAIIWNYGEELKQVSVSALVNNNVTKDAVPTESSTNPVESGGVYTALGGKENIATEESFANNTFLTLADNTIYTASEPIVTLWLDAHASGTSVVSFDTASSGSITITTIGIKFTETPTFGNNEHWEIAVRNGYGVFTKYDLV